MARSYPNVWSYADVFAGAMLSHNVVPVGLALLLGIALALMIGLACDRQLRRGTPPWMRVLAHRGTLLVGGVVLALVWSVSKRAVHAAHAMGSVPPVFARLALGLVTVTSVGLLTTWVALWWRRREYARVGETPMDKPLDLA